MSLLLKPTKRFLLRVFLMGGALALATFAGLVILRELRNPPLGRLQSALSSIEEARAAGADQWAVHTYQLARECAYAGRDSLARVSRSWSPFASYRLADSLLTESISHSRKAKSEAIDAKSSRRLKLGREIEMLRERLDDWRAKYDLGLPRTDNELAYRNAAFYLNMAENLWKNGQPEAAARYLDSSGIAVNRLQRLHDQQSTTSLHWIQKSRQWTKSTLSESRSKSKTALLVDKSRHLLFIIKSGKIIDSLVCDLGYNSGHQKRLAGDGATPEGMYRITRVNKASKYYLALLLDYPNQDDRDRFRFNLKSGAVPSGSKIGGLIEIHGHGLLGRDWTDGCVAVRNSDMDRLIKVAPVGTLVTIVRVWEGHQ